jgi:endonuclease G
VYIKLNQKVTVLLFLFLLILLWRCSKVDLFLLEEPRHNNDSTYVKHFAYSLSYNEATEQASWVAYKLDSLELASNFKRKNLFYIDTLVLTGTATNVDYKNSGYDRGHLAPAADMVWNEQAMNESFFYSNISPQLPSFNRGIWRTLEIELRKLALKYGSLYITCGPVFQDTDSAIGENKVVIPTHFYKTVLVYNSEIKQSIGFIFPHKKCIGEIFDYAVTVDSIENITGLDLYHKLPKKEENLIESEIMIQKW